MSDELTAEAYRLLSECEDDKIQTRLTDWEKDFLASNIARRDANLPITSDKVLAALRRIVAKKDEEPTDDYRRSRRYEGFSRGQGRSR